MRSNTKGERIPSDRTFLGQIEVPARSRRTRGRSSITDEARAQLRTTQANHRRCRCGNRPSVVVRSAIFVRLTAAAPPEPHDDCQEVARVRTTVAVHVVGLAIGDSFMTCHQVPHFEQQIARRNCAPHRHRRS